MLRSGKSKEMAGVAGVSGAMRHTEEGKERRWAGRRAHGRRCTSTTRRITCYRIFRRTSPVLSTVPQPFLQNTCHSPSPPSTHPPLHILRFHPCCARRPRRPCQPPLYLLRLPPSFTYPPFLYRDASRNGKPSSTLRACYSISGSYEQYL